MSVEARIKAALEDSIFEPKEGGSKTKQISIPGPGLSEDEVKEHRWVEDAFLNPNDEHEFVVIVTGKRERAMYRT